MQYARYASVKFLPATIRTGSRVRVSIYSPIGERERRVIRGYDHAKSFHAQVEDILADLGIDIGNPRVVSLREDEEIWVFDS